MARTSRSLLSASRLLGISSALLVLLSLLPSRIIRWENEISDVLTILLGPVQWPLREGVLLISGGGKPSGPESAEVADLRQRVAEYKTLWLNEQGENERLRRQIAELQKGVALNPQETRLQYAPIIGGGIDLSPGLLKAKAGEREQILPGSVAVVDGVHLVGRVTRVESRFCTIQPITQRGAGRVRGVIVFDDGTRGPLCDLMPTGAGTLNGAVLSPDESAPVEINRLRERLEAGRLEVRLDDSSWPSSAQMLIIGYVEEITPRPQMPTRPVVTVKPRFKLDRISEVVIRVPVESAGPGGDR